MATASAQPGVDECNVCHENVTNFKILPCAHILCCYCVVKWLLSDTKALCPLCRDFICQMSGDALPADMTMKVASVARAAILSRSHVCGRCQNTAATAICLNCGDMLCATCTVAHSDLTATKHHKVEDLSTLTAEDLAASLQMATLTARKSTLDGAISQLDAYLSDMDTARQASLADVERVQDRLRRFLDACCRRLREQAQAPYSQAEKKVEELKAALLKRRIGDRMPRVCDTTSSLDHEVILTADLKVAPKKTLVIDEKALECIERELRHLGQVPRTLDLSVEYATTASRVDSTESVSRVDYAPVSRADTTSPVSCAYSSSPVSCANFTPISGVGSSLSVSCANSSSPVPRNDSPSPVSVVDSTPPVLRAYSTPVSPRVTSDAISTQAVAQPGVWRFHTKHGGNIKLRNDQQTAERVREHEGSIVMSADAMISDTLYEVKMDTTRCILPCGVTDGTPASFLLPKDPAAWTQAVFIGGMYVWQYGMKPPFHMDCPPPPGSRVGLMVDTNNCLHVYVDGISCGVLIGDIRRPCHAFFEVSGDNHVISTLPLRPARE